MVYAEFHLGRDVDVFVCSLHHKTMWVTEPSQEHRQLSRLTTIEQEIYRNLTANRYGQSVRLEQERIEFGWLMRRLSRLPSICELPKLLCQNNLT